jgi:hypothetical protein
MNRGIGRIKQPTVDQAQREANQKKRTMLVLDNGTRAWPTYVIRDFDEKLLFSDRLVAVVEPQ